MRHETKDSFRELVAYLARMEESRESDTFGNAREFSLDEDHGIRDAVYENNMLGGLSF